MDEAASRYRILRLLGRGGMGEVHLAHDLHLDRRIALKFLTPAQAADDARRRLLREAKASAALDHPFICKTYETGELDGRHFIAMEYVEGATLKERLEGGAMPIRDALRLAVEMADALDYAHRRGVVHGDLKPANVMLSPEGHVKLLDFGVARRAPSDAAVTATATATLPGEVSGTLAYMAPEQFGGAPADAQTDVFAFGVVLHEMLTGVHPFLRPSALGTAGAILNDQPPPLPAPGVAEPEVLDHVLGRMLRKDRRERYGSVREIRADLAAILQGRPPRRAPRGTYWLAGAAAAAAVAALALWGLAWLGAEEPALAFNQRDWVLIADFENLTGDPALGRPLQKALSVSIEQSQHVNVVPTARIRQARQRAQSPADAPLDADLASELAVREGVRAVIAGSVAQVGDVYVLSARIVDPGTRLAVLTESARTAGRDEVLGALDDLGRRLRRRLGESLAGVEQQGRLLPQATTASLDALSLYAQAQEAQDSGAQVQLLREALALDGDFAMAHSALGLALYLRGNRVDGDVHFERALSLLDRLTTREQLWIRALAEDTRGRREAAVEHYKVYLAQYPDDAPAWFRLGWTYMAALQQPEQGAEAFRRVLDIDPNDAPAQVNLATCYAGLGRHRDAVAAYEQAFALRPEYLTGQYINHEYGFTLVHLGEIEKAEGAFRAMASSTDPALQARGLRSQALLDMYRGRYRAAAEGLRGAILLSRAHGYRLSEFRDRLFRALALEARGQRAPALEEVVAAGAIARQMTLAPDWLAMLGAALIRHGRVRDAERLLAQATESAADPTAVSGIARSTTQDAASMHLLRGEILLARREALEALQQFEIAHRVRPGVSTLDALGRTNQALEREAEAAARFTEVVSTRDALGLESQEVWLQTHLHLGRLHERAGRKVEARQVYEKLLGTWKDADPDLAAAREARERLARLNAGRP